MTRDDILRMAQEAGFTRNHAVILSKLLTQFAVIVAAHVRTEA